LLLLFGSFGGSITVGRLSGEFAEEGGFSVEVGFVRDEKRLASRAEQDDGSDTGEEHISQRLVRNERERRGLTLEAKTTGFQAGRLGGTPSPAEQRSVRDWLGPCSSRSVWPGSLWLVRERGWQRTVEGRDGPMLEHTRSQKEGEQQGRDQR
jgi:hypothetical protein